MADERTPRISLALALGVSTAAAMAWKFSLLAEPPHGEHAWRDATGIGVARGFLYESWNIVQPRVAERMNGTGVAGMELPLVPWLSAALMHLFGDSYFVARLPVWLSLIPLGWAALALARRVLHDETSARVAAACVVLQPLVIVFSRKLMPEIPMLALLLAGAAWALDGIEGSVFKCLLGGIALAVAAMLKPTGVAIAALVIAAVVTQWTRLKSPALLDPGASNSPLPPGEGQGEGADPARAPPHPRPSAGGRGESLALIARAAAVATIPLALAATWFLHARSLDEATGFSPIKLHQDWLEWTHLIYRPEFLSVVFGRIIHLYVLWPTIVWMIFGWRTALQVLRDLPALRAWMIASIGVVILFGSQNYQHAYYALPAAIPFAFWVGAFAGRFSAWVPEPRRLLVLFLIVFGVTSLARTTSRLPKLEFDATRVESALHAVPEEEPALVTDAHSPVVSLVTLHRYGWGVPATSVTPEMIDSVRKQGAKQIIESSFGGWLSSDARAALPPPAYADDQVRIYRLGQ